MGFSLSHKRVTVWRLPKLPSLPPHSPLPDGVYYSKETITWTIPKSIPPLLVGAGIVKELQVDMGVNLDKLSTQDIRSWGYSLASDKDAIVLKMPIGAPGGNYKVGMDVVPGCFR